jgi:Na+/phosphate symporter
MLVYLSLLVALIGVLMYVLSSNAKAQEIGRLSFACGLLAFLLKAAEPLINVLGGR